MAALGVGLWAILTTWILYRQLIEPNGGWRYMLRVRRGEFDGVAMDEVPYTDVRSTWGQYDTMTRTWFYGVAVGGVLGLSLVVLGVILLALGTGAP